MVCSPWQPFATYLLTLPRRCSGSTLQPWCPSWGSQPSCRTTTKQQNSKKDSPKCVYLSYVRANLQLKAIVICLSWDVLQDSHNLLTPDPRLLWSTDPTAVSESYWLSQISATTCSSTISSQSLQTKFRFWLRRGECHDKHDSFHSMFPFGKISPASQILYMAH